MNDIDFTISIDANNTYPCIDHSLSGNFSRMPHIALLVFLLFISINEKAAANADDTLCGTYPYYKLVSLLEEIERDRESRYPSYDGPIDVTELVSDYIPVGCNLPTIITRLNEDQFKLDGITHLDEDLFVAKNHLFKKNILYLFKPYLTIHIKYKCNKIISVKSYTSRSTSF